MRRTRWRWENCFAAELYFVTKSFQDRSSQFWRCHYHLPEPENYTPGLADEYFESIYGPQEKKETGISGLLHDEHLNLVPSNIPRIKKRKQYEANPDHASLKNKRDKRDQLKEKKFLAEQKKSQKGDE